MKGSEYRIDKGPLSIKYSEIMYLSYVGAPIFDAEYKQAEAIRRKAKALR